MSDFNFTSTGVVLVAFLATAIFLWRKKLLRLTEHAPLLASFDDPAPFDEEKDALYEQATPAATYLHLSLSGRVFVVRGDTKDEYWTDRDGLRRELARVKRANGMILYSRENPDQDPPEIVAQNFKIMTMAKVPLEMVADNHPFIADETLPSPAVTKDNKPVPRIVA